MQLLVATDRWPELSETFIASEVQALLDLGHRVRIEASSPAGQPSNQAPDVPVDYLTRDPRTQRLRDLAWLVARHPLPVARDLAGRRRWRREEEVTPLRALSSAARRLAGHGDEHVHVHFAARAALDWMRIARLTGVPYSVTAHAYEIFMEPANLREKLERAAFATTGCDYNVRELRAIAPGARVEKIVMGVDGERFRRRTSYGTSDGHVVAVGRLVEKKGFAYLVDAMARLSPTRLTIAGAGPLEEELRSRAAAAGAAVEFLGPRSPDEVRELLETADVLVMPCVVASNGDRDSMPVVVKEAMAMELPVVASDEVGLPELVDASCGRLVPPGDAHALAGVLRQLLALPLETRAAMGRAGRARVLDAADVRRETEKLVLLLERRP